MNRKYLNSILIVLLIVIWGSVIYKYFGKQHTNSKSQEFVDASMPFEYNSKMTKDTFKLELINTNPFKVLKKIKTSIVSKPSLPKKTQKKVVNPIIKWPTITYHGFVKGDGKTTRLILLKIENKLYRKREKETIKEVTLIKAHNDSLIVMFNNSKKTIKKIHD